MEKVQKDFDWVLKVLNSCETQTQVRRTEKLFDNFKNLHKEHFKSLGKKDQTKQQYKDIFKKTMKEMSSTVEKF